MTAAVPPRLLTQTDFEAVLDTPFVLHLGTDNDVEITLVEVRPQPSAAADWEMFSLLFEPGDAPLVHHDTFEVTHPTLGDFALFIGAVKNGAGELLYESVFNHPKHALS
jgi:hypothetical protein